MRGIIEFISKIIQFKQIVTPILYSTFTLELLTIQIIFIYPLQNYVQLNQFILTLLSTLDVFSVYAWLATTIVYTIICFALKVRLTSLKGFYLVCIYSSFNSLSLDKIGFSILLLILVICLLIILSFQNADSTFCSDSFLKEQENQNKIYATIIKIIIVIAAVMQLKIQIFYTLTLVLVLFLLVRRFFYPYTDFILQMLDIFFKTFFLSQSLLYLGISITNVYSNTLINTGFLISLVFSLGSCFLFEFYTNKKQKFDYEINQKFFLEKSIYIFRLFFNCQISQELMNYCMKINRFVEYERLSEFSVMHQKLNIENKMQWVNYIYDVIKYELKNSRLTFDHYINFALIQFYYKKNWIKSIEYMELAKNIQTSGENILEQIFRLSKLIKIHAFLEQQINIINYTKKLQFKQFDQSNRIVQLMIECTNQYNQLWNLLNQKQVYIQKIIQKTAQIKKQLLNIQQSFSKLQFKSRHLNKLMITFYYLVMCDCSTASKITKLTQKTVEKQYLLEDIQQYIYIQISMEKQNIGQFTKIGLNENLLKKNFEHFTRNISINDLIPIIIAEEHSKKMIDKLYNQKQYTEIFPFDKTTYCIIDDKLKMIDIFLKPLYQNDIFAVYGYLKFKKVKQNYFILIQQKSGQIIGTSEQLQNHLQLTKNRQELYIHQIFSELQGKQLCTQKQNIIKFEDEFGIINDFKLICLKKTMVGNHSICLFEIRKQSQIQNRKILKSMIDQFVKKQIISKEQLKQKLVPLSNSKLQKYFKKKKQIINQFGFCYFLKYIITIFLLIIFVLIIKGVQISINSQIKQFKINYLNTISYQQNKNWLIKRMYLQFFYTNFFFTQNIQFQTIDFSNLSQLNYTFTSLKELNKKIVPFLNKNQQFQVNIDRNKSFYSADIFTILQQALSQIGVIVILNLSTTNPYEINTIELANSFIQYNQIPIIASTQLNILSDFTQHTRVKYNTYIAYFYVNMIIQILLILILMGIIIKKQKQKNKLKQEICSALLSFQTIDLILFRQYSFQFLNLIKAIPNSRTDIQKKRLSVHRRAESGCLNLTGANDLDFILTQDELLNSKKQSQKKKLNLITENEQNPQSQKIINKAKTFNKFQIILFTLFAISTIAIEIYTLLNETNPKYNQNTIAKQYTIITQLGMIQCEVIYEYVNMFSTVNPSNSTLSQNSIVNYLNLKQNFLSFDPQYISYPQLKPFSLLLNQYFYAPIISYYNNGFYTNMTNTIFQSLILSICNILNSTLPNPVFNASLLDYIGWSQRLSYQVYYNLSVTFMENSINLLNNNFNFIRFYSLISIMAILVYLIFTIFYVLELYKIRKQNLNMLEILKQENFNFRKPNT